MVLCGHFVLFYVGNSYSMQTFFIVLSTSVGMFYIVVYQHLIATMMLMKDD